MWASFFLLICVRSICVIFSFELQRYYRSFHVRNWFMRCVMFVCLVFIFKWLHLLVLYCCHVSASPELVFFHRPVFTREAMFNIGNMAAYQRYENIDSTGGFC